MNKEVPLFCFLLFAIHLKVFYSSYKVKNLLPANLVQDFLRPMADFLMVFNSGVNVIIYCAFNPVFRERFVEVYFNCCRKMKSDASGTMISMTHKPRKTTQQTSISQQVQQETSL